MYNILNDRTRFENAYKSLENDIVFDNILRDMSCEMGAQDSCTLPNEICVQKRERSRSGIIVVSLFN